MICLYKIFPYWLQTTGQMDVNSNGKANGPYVRIRTSHKDDRGLIAHEVEGHVAEWWVITLISAIILSAIAYATQLYGLSQLWMALPAFSLMIQPLLRLVKPYKQWSEIRAYRIQLKYPPASLDIEYHRDLYARFIAEKYGLDISKEEALRLLN